MSKINELSEKTIIIIPAKNESKTIVEIIDKIKKLAKNVIVINDGSTDNSYNLLKKLRNIKIINNKISQGYDSSIQKGLSFALKNNYKFAITIDADFEHDPLELPNFQKKLNDGYDLVLGDRNRKNHVIEIIASLILKRLIKINDICCGYKGFNLDKIKKYNLNIEKIINGPQLVLLFYKNNYKIYNHKIKSIKRIGQSKYGGSFIGNIKLLISILRAITSIFR